MRPAVGDIAAAGFEPRGVVAALPGRVDRRGLTVGGAVPDGGFDSGEVPLPSQARGVGYAVPLRRNGRAVATRHRRDGAVRALAFRGRGERVARRR